MMSLLEWTWSSTDWILLLIAVGTIFYFWGTSTFSRFTKDPIPHLKPLPFIGSMGNAILKNQPFHELILDSYEKFKDRAYGVMFMFRQPIIMIRDPELIKTISVKDFEHFTDHRTVFFDQGDPVWSKGLFSLKGQSWRDMRITLTPIFTSSKMKTMFVLVSECCKQLVQFLEKSHQQPPSTHKNIHKDGGTLIIEFKDFYTRYANDVIATTAFGLGVDSFKQPTNKFYMMGQDATNFPSFKFFFALSMPTLMRKLGIALIPQKITYFFRSLVMDTIHTREKEGIVRPDLLQTLMQAKKEQLDDDKSSDTNKNTKTKLQDDDIIAQALLFFLAGFDTTSTLLCFVTHQLASHPDVQTRLQEEIDQSLEENGGKLTYEAIHSMKYLDMVVSETLRIYPPGSAVDRLCVKKYTLKSDPPLELEPGDDLFIPIFGLHRDPKYFPDPEKFDPERFSDENKHKINQNAYLPFGVGPRICIGNRFALMETKLAIAHILSKFTLKIVDKTPSPIKIIQKGFNMSIRGGFWLGLDQRTV